MLRFLFGEPPRVDAGSFLEVRQAIAGYLALIGKEEKAGRLEGPVAHRLSITARGFVAALDELEQSCYCCRRYAGLVHSTYVEEMNPEEANDYHRHVYFYKNGFIRVFSILDKLGVFLDQRLRLGTKNVKERFSYFTALRQMYEKRIEPELQHALYEDKQHYRAPLGRLRRQRNMEIHALNAELVDDMQQAEAAALSCIRLEDLQQCVLDLDQVYEMVCRSLKQVFHHFTEQRIV